MPTPYELSTEYQWILSSENKNQDIEGYFSFFDVEYTAGCNWDFVSIVVDGRAIANQIGYYTYCGNEVSFDGQGEVCVNECQGNLRFSDNDSYFPKHVPKLRVSREVGFRSAQDSPKGQVFRGKEIIRW